MLPSACLCTTPNHEVPCEGIYEPVHGSAPDIAGQGIANPVGMILSIGMMFKYSFARPEIETRLELAIESILARGIGTPDIGGTSDTRAVTDAIIRELCS